MEAASHLRPAVRSIPRFFAIRFVRRAMPPARRGKGAGGQAILPPADPARANDPAFVSWRPGASLVDAGQ